jgi:hypothetical protein
MTGDQFVPRMVFYLILITLPIIFFVLRRKRKLGPQHRVKPKNTRNFRTDLAPQATLRTIADSSGAFQYDVEEIDPAGRYIILGQQQTSWSHWEFYYPTFLTAMPDGGTLVQVGMSGKLFQFGLIAVYNHKRFVKTLQEAVMRRGGRVSS